MKTIKWVAAVDGDFADDEDWIGGVEPATTQTADLQTFVGQAYTVTFDTAPGGKHGKPVTIGGLDVGAGVTFDVEDGLDVGADKFGVPTRGQVNNEGTINVTTGYLIVTGLFTNDGVVDIADNVIDGYGGSARFVNNGDVLLSNDNHVDIGITSFENDGTLSGSGEVPNQIVNNGTIYGGNLPDTITGLILGSIANNGLIEASDGNTINVFGLVTGNGKIFIDGGSFLVGNDGVKTFSQDITFGTSKNSTFIILYTPENGQEIYTGTILGFSKTGNSTIELEDIMGTGAANVSYSGTKQRGTLTVTGGGHSDTIAFAGNYLDVTFSATMTAAGTFVTAAKSGDAGLSSVGALVQAMAALGGPAPHTTGHPNLFLRGHMESVLVANQSAMAH